MSHFERFNQRISLLSARVSGFGARHHRAIQISSQGFTLHLDHCTLYHFNGNIVYHQNDGFVFYAHEAKIRHIACFRNRAAAKVNSSVFRIRTAGFEARAIERLAFRRRFHLQGITAAHYRMMATRVTSTPFSMEISSRIFLLFNRGTINLIIRNLGAYIRRFRHFGRQCLRVRAQLVGREFIIVIARCLAGARHGATLAFFSSGSERMGRCRRSSSGHSG